MSEQIGFGEAVGAENQVDVYDMFPSFSEIDSPASVDSGMATSPLSTSPSSPSSPVSCEDTFSYVGNLTEKNKPELPEAKSNAALPNEATVKKLLEILLAAKTHGERSLITNLVTSLLTTTLKKSTSLPTPLSSIKNVVEQQAFKGRKRTATLSSDETPKKSIKTVAKAIAPVKPSIVIVEQPEKNYRARYESEGCRGPVHGSSELTFPTFKIKGYNGPIWATVYLGTSDGTPHFHLLCGPGSTKLPCRYTTISDGITAIQVMVSPETDMTAVLDCISLKRRRSFEADKDLRRRGLNPADWKSERKEACFVITAEIPGSPGQTITCKTRMFQCTAPPGNPEIWWMRPVKGCVIGGEEIGIIGKKFLKGFQVKFYGELPNGEMWQAYGDIDKSKTNSGACVVKSPALKVPITSPFDVNVEISGDVGNNYTCSDSVTFTYFPVEKPQPKESALLPETYQETLELSEILREISQMPSESAYVLDLGIEALNKEWKEILQTIQQLHDSGSITDFQNKELRFLVSQHDTILLEAFRTTKQSVSDSEFLAVFCQYLAGLNIPQWTN